MTDREPLVLLPTSRPLTYEDLRRAHKPGTFTRHELVTMMAAVAGYSPASFEYALIRVQEIRNADVGQRPLIVVLGTSTLALCEGVDGDDGLLADGRRMAWAVALDDHAVPYGAAAQRDADGVLAERGLRRIGAWHVGDDGAYARVVPLL